MSHTPEPTAMLCEEEERREQMQRQHLQSMLNGVNLQISGLKEIANALRKQIAMLKRHD